ncbi:MAG TPA: HAD-IC family P-type ATPase, partial [Thermoanaerobaculia bacterium]
MSRSVSAAFALPADVVAAHLHVDAARGLSQAELDARRAEFGANRVVRDASRSPWSIAARQFRNIVVALLGIAALIAFITRDAAEGLAIIGVLLINAIVGFVVEWRSERALESLRIQVRTTARVLRDGAQSIIDAEDLVPGDIIFLDPGAHVPADARLLEAIALRVDEAALTGESVPITKSANAVAADAPLA